MDSYKNITEVEMNKLVLPSHTNERQEHCLSGGQLLKWMDAAACLSAEKHARTSCVTASIDELYFEQQIYVGQVVNITARVNRAFHTSMEVGVSIRVEDLLSGEIKNVCNAFFTFVALDKNHQKQQLTPVVPFTEEEKSQYTLANERRRMRIQYPVNLRELAKKHNEQLDCEMCSSENETRTNGDLVPANTSLESVELVLPPHANHHQTAFGGQIMAWMVAACTITATRLCRSYPQLEAVDEVKFRGPIKVGDRVVIKTMVNNTYDVHMEVGCRVEAYSIGGEVRHVNSAFLIFAAPRCGDGRGGLKMLPKLRMGTDEEKRRALEAMARKRLRFEREQIRKSVGPVIAVPWNQCNGQLLNYNNIEALVKLYQLTKWQEVQSSDGVTLSKCESDNYLCVKVSLSIQLRAEVIFTLLRDEKARKEWDPLLIKVQVMEVVDNDDEILHMVLENKMHNATKPDDVVLLVSRRAPSDGRDHFTIAYRSVILTTLPPYPQYNRKEHLCSGLLIRETEGQEGKSTLTYINQTTRELQSYVMKDLQGVTSFYVKRFKDLEAYLLQMAPRVSLT